MSGKLVPEIYDLFAGLPSAKAASTTSSSRPATTSLVPSLAIVGTVVAATASSAISSKRARIEAREAVRSHKSGKLFE